MIIPCNYYVNVAKKIGGYYIHLYNIELGDVLPENAKELFQQIVDMHKIYGGDYDITLNYVDCHIKPMDDVKFDY